MRTALAAFVFLAIAALAGCGGAGGYGMGSTSPNSSSASPLSTSSLAGSAGYVSPTGFTVYVLSADSFNDSTCTSTGGCTGVWPVLAPPGGGASMPIGWSSFVRGDGQTQLSYNGWPLYTYSGDSAAGQTNGNGINSFGGVWSIARPGMAAAAGTPANDHHP
jgi:predicted lipoprotein with Yx(FWY)xxD motif